MYVCKYIKDACSVTVLLLTYIFVADMTSLLSLLPKKTLLDERQDNTEPLKVKLGTSFFFVVVVCVCVGL